MSDRPTHRFGLALDCVDPERLAGFWAAALDYVNVGSAGAYVAQDCRVQLRPADPVTRMRHATHAYSCKRHREYRARHKGFEVWRSPRASTGLRSGVM
jgi:hypothetical protein